MSRGFHHPASGTPFVFMRGAHPSTAIPGCRFQIPWLQALESRIWNLKLFLTAPATGCVRINGRLSIRTDLRARSRQRRASLMLSFTTDRGFVTAPKSTPLERNDESDLVPGPRSLAPVWSIPSRATLLGQSVSNRSGVSASYNVPFRGRPCVQHVLIGDVL